jgi:hypothetical protein
MILVAAALAAGMTFGTPVLSPITPRVTVLLRADEVRLADVADLSSLPDALRQRAAPLVLGRFRQGRAAQSISVSALFARARTLMPELSLWLPPEGKGRVSLQRDTSEQGDKMLPCFKAETALAAGVPVSARNFRADRCNAPLPASAFRYDRARQAVLTTRALLPGEPVRRFTDAQDASVNPGDQMILTVGIGPVRVQRQVEALQHARAGQKLFVKTQDGEIMAIPLSERLP